jgi:uncharacterized protein YvpB
MTNNSDSIKTTLIANKRKRMMKKAAKMKNSLQQRLAMAEENLENQNSTEFETLNPTELKIPSPIKSEKQALIENQNQTSNSNYSNLEKLLNLSNSAKNNSVVQESVQSPVQTVQNLALISNFAPPENFQKEQEKAKQELAKINQIQPHQTSNFIANNQNLNPQNNFQNNNLNQTNHFSKNPEPDSNFFTSSNHYLNLEKLKNSDFNKTKKIASNFPVAHQNLNYFNPTNLNNQLNSSSNPKNFSKSNFNTFQNETSYVQQNFDNQHFSRPPVSLNKMHQLDEYQKLQQLYSGKKPMGRHPSKQYKIQKPKTSLKLEFLDNNYKVLFANVFSYFLIFIVLLGGFYLTFGGSSNPEEAMASNQTKEIMGASEQKQESKKPEETISLPKEVKLEIELIKQDYPLSSALASLEMALMFYEIEISQDEILNKIGYSSPLRMQQIGDEIIWGDPNEGFVGDVNGWFTGNREQQNDLKLATGWGVGNRPIAQVAKEYLPNSKDINEGGISQLKKALADENPVIFWHRRADSNKETLKIKTNNGKQIDFFQNHVNLLIGYREEEKGQTIYYFLDPYYGEIEVSEEKLLEQWELHGRKAVIVAE